MGLLGNFGTSLTLLLAHLSLFRAHREHKVHNIVLYPDKESWCKTTPIKQVVTWPQCSSQELDNNVCVGACFSYMVPHSEPSAPGDLIRPYCDSCQPLDSIWHTVTLDCKDKDDNPTTMQKKVQIITNCSCSSCMESSRIKPDFNSLLQSLELESARVGGHHPPPPASPQHHAHHHHPYHNGDGGSELATAPESGQTSGPGAGADEAATLDTVAAAAAGAAMGSGHHHQQQQQQPADVASSLATAAGATMPQVPDVAGAVHEAPDLLLNPNLNGSSKSLGAAGGAKAHERFLQLFKQLNDPNVAADKLEKLAKLESLEKLEKLEKLASEYSGAKELLAKLSELLHKYSSQDEQQQQQQQQSSVRDPLDPLDVVEDEEDDDNDDSPNEDQLQLQLHHRLGSSSMAPPPALPDQLPKDEDDEEVPSLQDQQLRVAASLLHRTGPHHSMVLDSGVKEKIDVESHYLHPALAGQEISYHDNVLPDKTKKKDF